MLPGARVEQVKGDRYGSPPALRGDPAQDRLLRRIRAATRMMNQQRMDP
jgi:hypothetical protein